jgi:hypothetical protein
MDAQTLLKIHSAVRWGKPVAELKKLGLKDTAAAQMPDESNGNTALHIAAQNGHYDIVLFLVNELNCYVDAQNKVGNTPLHMGVEYDYYKINRILVNAGADHGIENGDGHRAIEGISGSKVGLSSWDNPVTMLRTVQDSVESLEEVFRALETSTKGDLKKEDLVRVGMSKKKELRAWKDGAWKEFQPRFMAIAAKL